ncbi:TRAFAC clade GTPase domain-containing protein [Microvirga tunisiensis]|uniref:Double-GTPase 2 domain-containing protein n=1 Tax=Microvirga tunisiensis TaxID=2108360 RepID=A0A5N7MVE5_9HYPH|nr:hypothetical protein [Microvirga tunisiensis]MPR13065.1 hypothetical protein [Microvirga tunisiensis]MPR30963.1 hypothetical protein [Microvirga tunisiensis]
MEAEICKRTGGSEPCDMASTVAQPASLGDLEGEIDKQTALALRPESELQDEEPRVAKSGDHRLHPGMELGMPDLQPLMDEDYGHVITILGAGDAGKTSFLCSLYCMAASGDLEAHGYRFAGSLTLPGFEARTRKSRNWEKGKVPDRMTYRTQYEVDRGAGFMHLDLHRIGQERRMRLFLSDLPGEWTTTLIDNARNADRLRFIDRSDGILILIDGPTLLDRLRRGQTLNQHKILIDRISAIVPNRCPIAVLATKGDQIGMTTPPALDDIVQHARRSGFQAHGAVISSFSGVEEVCSGAGVVESLMTVLASSPNAAYSGTRPEVSARPARFFGWAPVTRGEAR